MHTLLGTTGCFVHVELQRKARNTVEGSLKQAEVEYSGCSYIFRPETNSKRP